MFLSRPTVFDGETVSFCPDQKGKIPVSRRRYETTLDMFHELLSYLAETWVYPYTGGM